jgi:hypothetical protein
LLLDNPSEPLIVQAGDVTPIEDDKSKEVIFPSAPTLNNDGLPEYSNATRDEQVKKETEALKP